jgi:hypothetical protein
MIEIAAQKGLYIALLPTWGDKVLRKWRGEEIFTPDNALQFGYFIGKRYGACKNLIWVLGGDRPCERESDFAVWRAMAQGIKSGEKDAKGGFHHLMTYHPLGNNTSSTWFHNDNWLDFNMIQSGHARKDGPCYRMIQHDYALKPTKPVLDGEPRYENHPVRGDSTKTQWFDDFDIRQAAYWAFFSGAFGHTYGCHDIWMMYDGTPARQCADARTPWREAVDLPGAWQMLYLRQLMLDEKLLYEGHTPYQELIAGENPEGTGYKTACRTNNNKGAFVYLPTGAEVELHLNKLDIEPSHRIFLWFNPGTGRKHNAKPTRSTGDSWKFQPPGMVERGNDWVLVIKTKSN